MHELAVTESLLKTSCAYAKENGARKVSALTIKIGDLSGIIDDSVQFYWDIIAEDTICEKSTLQFKRIPAEILCEACGQTFIMQGELIPCPNCGSLQLKIISGDDFTLESIDIEREE